MRYFLLTLILVSTWAITACHKREASETENSRPPSVEVKLATVEAKTMPTFEPAVGTVRPRLEATISSDILGRVIEYNVVSGQKITRGDVIARINADELEAAQIRADAALKQMELEVVRHKKLLDNNATSRARYEQADAAEKMARASLAKINATLEKAIVRAPFTGTITRRLAATGDLATPGRALVQMEDPTTLRLETPVAESLAGALTLGQSIKVHIESLNLSIQGTISELEPSADSSSRTFMVRIDLPPSQGLRAGLFGRAWIPRGKDTLLIVPSSAILRKGQMELAFVVEKNTAKLRLVRTVPNRQMTDHPFSTVISGLSKGESIILAPDPNLKDGTPVTSK